MNRKRIALITSLIFLSDCSIESFNPLKNDLKSDVQAVSQSHKKKTSDKYPNISKELDITSMEQYSSNVLFMNLTLRNFHVKDIYLDDQGTYHLLLTPLKTSNQYFVTTIKSSKTIKIGDKITIQGFINGKVKVHDEHSFNPKYNGKKPFPSLLIILKSISLDTIMCKICVEVQKTFKSSII